MQPKRVILETIVPLSTIQHVVDNEYRIRWGFDIDEQSHKMSYTELEWKGEYNVDVLKKIVEKWYNDQCDNEILQGLTFQGNAVWLSLENQFNFKAAYDFAFQNEVLGLEYESPIFKLGSTDVPVYKTFDSFMELTDFIKQCFTHIKVTLDKYWILKDSIDYTQYQLPEI